MDKSGADFKLLEFIAFLFSSQPVLRLGVYMVKEHTDQT